MINLYFDMI